MKDSLKKFYDYLDSDNELTTYVRLNAEWNEKSFCEMRKLVKEVMEDYMKEDYYPKRFVYYFMSTIPSTINMLSQMKVCKEIPQGYTEESYVSMVSEKIKLLDTLSWEFDRSFYNH